MKIFFDAFNRINGKWKERTVYPTHDPELSADNPHKNTMLSATMNKMPENMDQGGRPAKHHSGVLPSDEESSNAPKSEISDTPIVRSPSKMGKTYLPKMFDVWIFGIATVIGGQYYGWNGALKAGFGSYCIAQMLMGFSFVNLAFSLAEIISTTSFSGGAYGMARIVLGFYPGFIVAAFEFMEYASYISFSAVYIGEFLCETFEIDHGFSGLFCLAFYLISLVFVIEEDKWLWRLNYILGLLTLVILLIYCFGSLGYVDFAKNATLNENTADPNDMKNWFAGGMFAFMQCLPYTTWAFGGIESAALITDMVENPRVNLSYGMALSVCTLFATMIFIMFVGCSLPPSMQDFIEMDNFMDIGWGLIGVNTYDSHWLMFPAQVAMAFGFFLPTTKLLYSMAQSNLVPQIFGLKEKDSGKQDHRLACFYVATISFLICLLDLYIPQLNLENVPILLGQLTYLSDLYAFYRMRSDFPTRDYKFRNPFGIPGAVFAGLYFILTAIAIVGFMDDNSPIFFVSLYFILLSMFYFGFAKQHQSFSDDEQKSLLKLHVIKNNQRRRLQKAAQKRVNGGHGGQGGQGGMGMGISMGGQQSSSNQFGGLSWSRFSNTSNKSNNTGSRLVKPPLNAPTEMNHSHHPPAATHGFHSLRKVEDKIEEGDDHDEEQNNETVAERYRPIPHPVEGGEEKRSSSIRDNKPRNSKGGGEETSSRRIPLTGLLTRSGSGFDQVVNNTKGSLRLTVQSMKKEVVDPNEADNEEEEPVEDPLDETVEQ